MRRTLPIMVAAVLALFGAGMTVSAQSWSLQINKASRFRVLSEFNDQAVLDLETGLVWERSPSTTKYAWNIYLTAHIWCDTRPIGNRLGWKLPTIQELASLVDPTHFRPALTPGHPFILSTDQATNGEFWSSTTAASDSTTPNSAWFITFYVLDPQSIVLYGSGDKSTPRYAWCVRTGSGIDPQ
jgi:hypothetical protein